MGSTQASQSIAFKSIFGVVGGLCFFFEMGYRSPTRNTGTGTIFVESHIFVTFASLFTIYIYIN